MAAGELTLEEIYNFLKEKGGKVKNRDAVRYFKGYLTDPATKDENRMKFKTFVNTLAHTKTEGDEKVLILKTKYLNTLEPPPSPLHSPVVTSPHNDPRNSIGIPISPSLPDLTSPTLRPQPPPYRPPPPVSSPSLSLDNVSLGSLLSLNEAPQAPPRRRDADRTKSLIEDSTPKKSFVETDNNGDDKQTVSVKERTQKFNRLASVEDELSPRQPKSAEKEKKNNWGANEDDGASVIPLEPKKCMEWYVTASKGDFQELLRLANAEPRLVNKKDPFTAYTVLHWGAKYGNADIIKIFAGNYRVDVNGRTNGGYTPLHISAQFGHKDIFKLLIEVYKADPKLRDYSGRTPEYYLLAKEGKRGQGITLRKIKGRKKQSEKDLGFLRIGSLNVRVKKTTEAFSNFLGVGSGGAVNPADTVNEKVHKGWGSADNVSKDSTGAPKGYAKKKTKRIYESGGNSTPTTPKTPTKSFNSINCNDSDSDTAAGFDSNWKN